MMATVLLVDDDPDALRIGELSLARIGGWKVLTASSGELAVQVARIVRLALVLLPVHLPGLDGPATLRRLREIPAARSVPVIFTSTDARREDVARYRELGATGVIAKPFDPRTLPTEVRRLVGW